MAQPLLSKVPLFFKQAKLFLYIFLLKKSVSTGRVFLLFLSLEIYNFLGQAHINQEELMDLLGIPSFFFRLKVSSGSFLLPKFELILTRD